ncbi:MAG: type II toxin-antitoxin system VapC family toxin [Verrucomicrobiia bacterium]
MKALIDTGVWFRRYHRLPMSAALRSCLENEVEEFHLCPLSIAELTFKWRSGRLPGVPNPDEWLEHSLQNYYLEAPGASACLKAGMWDWDHGDLVDRTLAAIAAETGLVLVHTDSVLKDLQGFPQRFFRNRA